MTSPLLQAWRAAVSAGNPYRLPCPGVVGALLATPG